MAASEKWTMSGTKMTGASGMRPSSNWRSLDETQFQPGEGERRVQFVQAIVVALRVPHRGGATLQQQRLRPGLLQGGDFQRRAVEVVVDQSDRLGAGGTEHDAAGNVAFRVIAAFPHPDGRRALAVHGRLPQSGADVRGRHVARLVVRDHMVLRVEHRRVEDRPLQVVRHGVESAIPGRTRLRQIGRGWPSRFR